MAAEGTVVTSKKNTSTLRPDCPETGGGEQK